MKINRISKGEMPPENKYILAYLEPGERISSSDPFNVNWVIVMCIYGISKKDREKLRHSKNYSDRIDAVMYSDYDEEGNGGSNLTPYAFYEFSGRYHCGQKIDFWCELPNAKEMVENET